MAKHDSPDRLVASMGIEAKDANKVMSAFHEQIHGLHHELGVNLPNVHRHLCRGQRKLPLCTRIPTQERQPYSSFDEHSSKFNRTMCGHVHSVSYCSHH